MNKNLLKEIYEEAPLDKNLFLKYSEDAPLESLSNIVYNILYDAIVIGKLKPGEKINVNQFAQNFNLSRTPIVDACEALKNIKYIEVFSNKKGYYVSQIYFDEFKHLSQVREILEISATSTVTLIHNLENIKEMYKLAKEFRILFKSYDNYSAKKILINDMHFHELLFKSTKNSYLIEIYSRLIKIMQRYLYFFQMLMTKSPNEDVLEECSYQHISICKAIDSGIPYVAEKAMERHMITATSIHTFRIPSWD